jgi:hypothetical protein
MGIQKKKKKKKTNIKATYNSLLRGDTTQALVVGANIRTYFEYILTVGIRVCQEVALNSLEKSSGLFFASLNLLFIELTVAFGVVLTGNLQDGSSIMGCHDLDLVRDLLERVPQRTTLDHAVAVFKVCVVDLINLVLHVLEMAA